MLRVLERLRKYRILVEENPENATVYKRVGTKMPLFRKMFAKLKQKRGTLSFNSVSIYSKSGKKHADTTESTFAEGMESYSDGKSYQEGLSVTGSVKSMLLSLQTNNEKSYTQINESFDLSCHETFDHKLEEIRLEIQRLEFLLTPFN